ncbi:MAG: penicillin-binding transpeptidase domain-containing protein [Atopococcus tabaci]|uniref:Penicillin-binding transpeptidase domain-containing protein n=1 Tax=Atopococcus tabaci TaxID=269774 RepID=A0AA43ZRQ7_9LACT|nr:penicillin-binding transpeptidase domain-containing protein [Atopococcus tabaci]
MKSSKSSKNRKIIVIIVLLLTLAVYILFVLRFSYIMITSTVDGERLDERVEAAYTQASHMPAKRGNILDKNGEPIATSSTSYKMVAILTDEWSQSGRDSNHVEEIKHTAQVLSQYIPLDEDEIHNLLDQGDVKQVEFGLAGSDISYELKTKIEEENLSGIHFEEMPARIYPNGVFASHLVGLAQSDTDEEEDDLEGVLGLEASLQDILSGEDGGIQYEKDFFGYALPNKDAQIVEAEDGMDVYLTLDRSIQMYMESVVTEVNKSNPSAAITATLMDPKTGHILAASQRPTFNATTKENMNETWQNFHVEYTYEPGSTMKALTLAAAIDQGVFNPDEFFESGFYNIEGSIVNDVKPEGWGMIDYIEGIARSSNVAFVKLFEKMGGQTWKAYLDAFQFGQKTGVSLPNENAGSNPYSTTIQQANTAFGQGITVTPMQMMQAFSALANGGKMMQPQLVDKIVDPADGQETHYESKVAGQPVSAETAQQTLDYLTEATYNPNSTTGIFHLDGYELALKTGTSEIVDPETGQYMTGPNENIYSAVGFAPAKDPKYLLYVTVQQPEMSSEASYGAQVVSNIFNPIMKWTLDRSEVSQQLDIENSGEEIMPQMTGLSVEEAHQMSQELGKEVFMIGTGSRVVQQYPIKETDLTNHENIILMANGAMSMPDLKNASKSDVLKVSELTGIQFNINGSGYVESQSIEPGTLLKEDTKVTVNLSQDRQAEEE